ncbi:MAG: AarF/ABC1/UbiB kinase family protein [Firmicutes bacterium]|nr:AarF/ABC1/UbiB kinase family protein [Alicyclobacillaceae bacterium]MCL6496853.1 AarF/ABC1/UbiB kinase family protein [Bacillota bacterium]
MTTGRRLLLSRAAALRRTLAVLALAWTFWRDARILARIRRQGSPKRSATEAAVWQAAGERLRDRAVALGGLIIKVGQFLSARADLFPPEFLGPLKALQDQVPGAPWEAVVQRLQAAFGPSWREWLTDVEPQPVAAASLGQVHRARLAKDGQPVALKIQRPGIEAVVAADLWALAVVAWVLERWTAAGRRLGLMDLWREFQAMVAQELDYVAEAEHQAIFADRYGSRPGLYVPKVYPAYTRRTVLVMEYVDGQRLEAEADETLSRRLVDLYLDQLLEAGWVQVDPHPGNFLRDAEGRLVLLDFGMVMAFSPEERRSMTELVLAAVTGDAVGVVDALDALGFVRPEADRGLLARAVRGLLRQIGRPALQPGPETQRLANLVQEFVYEKPLRFPARYLFLGRALGILFGLAARWAPDLDWVALLRTQALPRLERLIEADTAWAKSLRDRLETVADPAVAAQIVAWLEQWVRRGQRWARLPDRLDRVLTMLEEEALPTRPYWAPLMGRLERLERRLQALVWIGWAVGAALAARFALPPPWSRWAWGASAAAALWALHKTFGRRP